MLTCCWRKHKINKPQLVGVKFFHEMARKALHRPMHAWEMVMWQDVFEWKQKSASASHLCSSHHGKKPNHVFSQNKSQCPEFLFHIKVQSFEVLRRLLSCSVPVQVAQCCSRLLYPGSCLGPAFGVCKAARPTWSLWREWMNNRVSMCSGKDKELLCQTGLYSLWLGLDQALF